jgi:hypothetical protein
MSIATTFNIRTLAPTIDFLEATGGLSEGVILPIMDLEKKTFRAPTQISHHKFAAKESKLMPSMKNPEDFMYAFVIGYLHEIAGIPMEQLDGKWIYHKLGFFSIANEYESSIRIWSSKKVGKNIIYQVSFATYKDSVEKPMRN